jgi:hypothetical protein
LEKSKIQRYLSSYDSAGWCCHLERERNLRATTSNSAKKISAGKGRPKPPIFLLRWLRGMSHWAIGQEIASKLARLVGLLVPRLGLRLEGGIADRRRRHSDHTEFWSEAARRYPSDAAFVRGKANAALRAGKAAEAESALATLVQNRKARISDCRFIIGLTFVDQHMGNSTQIRIRVRSFLASLRGTSAYRIAAVRLSRIIFAHFTRNIESAKKIGARRDQFLRMLERSAVPAEPKELLRRAAFCEAQLERRFAGCLLDTDISAAQCRIFVSLVRSRLALGQPFAMVRAGDGEAACLPYEPNLMAHAQPDARERERIWWGRPLTSDLRARIAPAVARAIWDADCIGIPTIARFLRELRLDQSDTLEGSLTGRGLRALLYSAERYSDLRSPGLASPMFTSCHLHQDLAIWNCYEELLDGVRDVVLVSCHPDLADLTHTRFGAHIASNIVLPADRVSGPLLRMASSQKGSLPEILDSVIENIRGVAQNRLVMVGAGYPGKILVSVARQQGGIALDIGSIFDYWMGLKTRSYLDLDSG